METSSPVDLSGLQLGFLCGGGRLRRARGSQFRAEVIPTSLSWEPIAIFLIQGPASIALHLFLRRRNRPREDSHECRWLSRAGTPPRG